VTHVVTEACINCKHSDCVIVCPVDCFYEGPNFLTINPDECIDCGVCIPECPEKAIFPDTDKNIEAKTGQTMDYWVKLNGKLAERWSDNNIVKKIDSMPDSEKWSGQPLGIKLPLLDEG